MLFYDLWCEHFFSRGVMEDSNLPIMMFFMDDGKLHHDHHGTRSKGSFLSLPVFEPPMFLRQGSPSGTGTTRWRWVTFHGTGVLFWAARRGRFSNTTNVAFLGTQKARKMCCFHQFQQFHGEKRHGLACLDEAIHWNRQHKNVDIW